MKPLVMAANKALQFIVFTPILCILFWMGPTHAAPTPPKVAVQLDLVGAIGPATADYISRGIQQANAESAKLVLIRLDTPGGLDASMRQVTQSILASKIPVICFVGPSGAEAASAGLFILYACHIAAMAPGTNLGAASPVGIGGGDITGNGHKTLDSKVLNNARAYIRALAQLRGRNVEFAENAVNYAASMSAGEALSAHAIDLVSPTIPDLLSTLNGRMIKMTQNLVELDTSNLLLVRAEQDMRSLFLSIITDPSIAYLLLLLGAYGLFFEFTHPGFVLPGVVGGISLLVALYAMQMLPINYAGMGLLILGIMFMVGEAFMPSFGALGIGGVIAFILGSIFLFNADMMILSIAWPIIAIMTVFNVVFMIFVLGMVIRIQRRKVVSGREDLIDKIAKVIDDSPGDYRVMLQGEIWHVECSQSLQIGDSVTVKSITGLTLRVQKVDKSVD